MKKFFLHASNIISTFIVFLFIFLLTFVLFSYFSMPNPSIEEIKNPPYTSIYDENDNLIEILGKDKKQYVEYEDLPPLLIYALVSIEDATFFDHQGIDYARTFQAFLHNLTSSSKHGGSTITQQLVKNMYLNSSQTYKRKIQEAFLAYKLESILTKEQILTHYFNYVYFEQTLPGVSYASLYYFSKEVKDLTLPEMAILAGVVKSASFYNPIKYPDRVDKRKNLVLKNMYEQNYISKEEYIISSSIHTSSLIRKATYQEPTYKYQAYLDVVYQEVIDLLGLDPFTRKLEIHTYLDSSLQNYLDSIQNGEVIDFNDDLVQIGGSVLSNDSSSIIGVIGGRNYNGSRLFSRAYSLIRQPASTIKPVFGYLLASEHLSYNGSTPILDEPYIYPNSTISVQNADKSYLGYISMEEALGYSKNTSALYTLEKVIDTIGQDKAIEHLKKIGLWDDGPFSYSYGIGGFSNGISPIALSGAYRVISARGNYLKPSTIREIKDAKTKEILYSRDLNETNIVKEESAFVINKTLRNVVDNNYYGIGVTKAFNSPTGAKTGTNGYDKNVAKSLGYPITADKDSWVAGFSPTHTIAIWAGFDKAEIGQNTYFGSGDERRRLPKKIFKKIIDKVSLPKSIEVPSSLSKVYVVKHANDYYLPNKYIPSSYLIEGYFYSDNIPTRVLPEPSFPAISNPKIIYFSNEIIIDFELLPLIEEPFNYSNIYGEIGYLLTIEKNGEVIEEFYTSTHITLSMNFDEIDSLSIKTCFKLAYDICSESLPLLF